MAPLRQTPPLLPVAVVLVAALSACHSTDEDAADGPASCPGSAKDFCASTPERCPTAGTTTDFCNWLLRDGPTDILFGGPVVCADGGLTGYGISGDGGERLYLYDDAGVAAVVDLEDKGKATCLGGNGPVFPCIDGIVGYRCRAVDAGTE